MARRGISLLAALIAVGLSAFGQTAYLPSRLGLPNGLHLSLQTGWGYYGGDLDAAASGRGVLDPALTAELAWQPLRHIGLAFGARRTRFTRLSSPQGEGPLLSIGYGMVRLSPSSGRFTPYAQVGLHRTFGGNEVGYGPGGGLGLAISFGPTLHLFAESSMFFVFPDHAVDGTSGGSDFDQLGFFGFGVRIANPGVRYPRPTSIDFVEGPRFVTAGMPTRFRAVPARRGTGPVFYLWSTGAGPVLAGQDVEITFDEPGPATLTVQALNAAGSVSETLNLVVVPGEPAVPRTPPVTTRPEPEPELKPEPKPEPEPEPKPAPPPVVEIRDEPTPPAPPVTQPPTESPATPSAPLGRYVWVVGSFPDERAASNAATRYRMLGADLQIQPATPTPAGRRYRVTHGAFESRSEALRQRPPAPADAWLLELPHTRESPSESVIEGPTPGEKTAPLRRAPFFAWIVASLPDRTAAEEEAARYHQAGMEAEILPATVSGRTTFRVAIGHYRSRYDALAYRNLVRSAGAPADMWLMIVKDLP